MFINQNDPFLLEMSTWAIRFMREGDSAPLARRKAWKLVKSKYPSQDLPSYYSEKICRDRRYVEELNKYMRSRYGKQFCYKNNGRRLTAVKKEMIGNDYD